MKTLFLVVTLAVFVLASARGQQQSNIAVRIAHQSNRVCVIGNVVRQGELQFDDRLLLTDALRQVGGIRPHSRDIRIYVAQPIGGRPGEMQEIKFDVGIVKKKSFKNFELHDRDVIEVSSQKRGEVPNLPDNICPWVPFNRNRM